MTNPEAKELTIEVWTYLAEHSEVASKTKLPDELFSKIKDLKGYCPLCELFYRNELITDNISDKCTGCPLNTKLTNCFVSCSPFMKWVLAINNNQQRKEAATEIVNIVKKREV